MKHNPTYTALSSGHAQLTMRKVRQNFSSYFSLLQMKQKGIYQNDVRPPQYLNREGYFKIEFINRQIKCYGAMLRLTLDHRDLRLFGKQYIYVKISKNIRKYEIKGVRIVSKYHNYFEINYLYEPVIQQYCLDLSEYLSIDFGVMTIILQTPIHC